MFKMRIWRWISYETFLIGKNIVEVKFSIICFFIANLADNNIIFHDSSGMHWWIFSVYIQKLSLYIYTFIQLLSDFGYFFICLFVVEQFNQLSFEFKSEENRIVLTDAYWDLRIIRFRLICKTNIEWWMWNSMKGVRNYWQ